MTSASTTLFTTTALALLASACGEDDTMVAAKVAEKERPWLVRVETDADVVRTELQKLSKARIWFGHHSVGDDILDGVRALAAAHGVEVTIGEERIGENGKPLDKIADFERAAIATEADIVAMKLCYADFTPTTDAAALADAYERAVERIRRARPDVKILHTTPPLTVREDDAKTKLKRVLGRPVWSDDANLRRLEYAERIQARFDGEPVFDLALVESTRKDGAREIHLVETPNRARQVPMLWSGWSRDGGHLNDAGKRVAARAFIRALAAML